jgi:hypothetical protein
MPLGNPRILLNKFLRGIGVLSGLLWDRTATGGGSVVNAAMKYRIP